MDSGVSSTNMSVGDASIIKAALNRSEILTELKCFWKVSGRLWINNKFDISKDKRKPKKCFSLCTKI